MCVTDPWAHMSLVHSILSIKLGVTFMSFQNKTHSFLYMTLSSLSIYVVFVDPRQGNKDVMPFSLPTTNALCGVHR